MGGQMQFAFLMFLLCERGDIREGNSCKAVGSICR